MKTKKEILEILKNDVISYEYIKNKITGNSISFEVLVRNVDYSQLRRLIDELLWIEQVDDRKFKLVFSKYQITDK